MTIEEIINGLIHIAAGNWDENSMAAITEAITILESQPTLPAGLEEAAYHHVANNGGRWLSDDIGIKYYAFNPQEVKDAFKAGAEYQRKQDQSLIELAEDHAMLAGMNKMQEEMMEKAVEADVNTYEDLATGESWAEFVVEMPTKNLCDKVRVIVIPEEK